MDLKNGYKTIYEVVEERDGKKCRVFSAVKADGTVTEICVVPCGEYKLVYEKDGAIYGSKTGRVEGAIKLNFDEVFVTGTTNTTEEPEVPATTDPVIPAHDETDPEDLDKTETEQDETEQDDPDAEV